MKRRQFLSTAGKLISLPFLFKGLPLSAMARPSFLAGRGKTDRVLVLIQLNGGNDGLSTLVPLDQYQNLYRARPNVIIPERQLLPFTDTIGLHPALSGLQRVYEDGRLGIVQNVGYPNQNRSHFRSMEVWSTASSAADQLSTGWVGRYLDHSFPDFPGSYPNGEEPDPFAISMGYYPSETCQGAAANFSITLEDPFALRPLNQGEEDGEYGPHYRDELDFVRMTIAQTNRYAEQISGAAERGSNVVEYPDNKFAEGLKNVARLISGGLQTKIYVVSLGGFDTHSNQVLQGDPLKGRHQELLQTLSDAIHVFQQDLQQQRLEERVVGMTFSEFGRQIRSNGSHGTDHGTAAPLILFGACVNNQVLGDNPRIEREVAPQAGVPMQYDFRDVYGSVLMDWFDLPREQVLQFIHQDFQYLPLITGCAATSTGAVEEDEFRFFSAPNPYRDWTKIHFRSERAHVHLSVLDNRGREVGVLLDQQLPAGEHSVRFNGRHLPAGVYFCRLMADRRQRINRLVKIS